MVNLTSWLSLCSALAVESMVDEALVPAWGPQVYFNLWLHWSVVSFFIAWG